MNIKKPADPKHAVKFGNRPCKFRNPLQREIAPEKSESA